MRYSRRIRKGSVTPVFFILPLIILATISCRETELSSGHMQLSPTPIKVNPSIIIDSSKNIMAELKSFKFDLSHRKGAGSPMEGFLLVEAVGLIEKPNMISVEATMLLGNIATKGGIVTIDEKTFILNPLTKEWEKVESEIGLLNFFDPQEGISSIMDSMLDPQLIESNDDRYIIRGEIPAPSFSPLLGETTDNDVTAEISISRDSYLLTNVRVTGRLNKLDEDGLIRIIEISRFNQPLYIAEPETE
ncbi:MAG: hypothetical protein BZY65_01810 [SAR202 cluster bacterium Ae2-Chloro-G2]|nr:MAG: hypothetical protein BZY65_01810 [SAR202 cluster bacterium Ae2-Chloro-G2]